MDVDQDKPPSRFRRLWIALAVLLPLIAGALYLLAARPGEERPPVGWGDGEGSAYLDPADPVPVGSWGTWSITFVTGGRGIASGGGIVFHLPLFWEWTPPQMSFPERPGFVSVTCSRPDLRYESFAVGEHHYVRFLVEEGSLLPGDTVRVTYGDTARGTGAAARADGYAERGQEFLVKVDGDGDGFFEELDDSPQLDIQAGPAAQLRIYVKGEAKLVDTTHVTVAALDRNGNLCEAYRGTVRFSHAYDVVGLPPNYAFRKEDRGARLFSVRFRSPGFHTLRVVEEGGTLECTSNPIRVTAPGEEVEYTLLWGDLHQHSRLSDGTGEPDDLYRYARHAANLDVMALTDHDHHGLRPLGQEEWEVIRQVNEAWYEPGAFVTFLAYEWTNWVYGHRNVYYEEPQGEVFSMADSSTNSPGELWDSLVARGAMTIAHHTGGGPVPIDWSIAPPPSVEHLVEISSVHGSSEHVGCAKQIYNPVPGAFVVDALDRGYRLGFIGSGDGHVGHPGENYSFCGGLAGIYATGRTRAEVWEALCARRTYATSGERIILDVRLGEHRMGEEVPAGTLPDLLRFEVDARGTAVIAMAELIADGAPVDTLFGIEEQVQGVAEAPKDTQKTSYYYVRITQMDGGLAWSSPIWVVP
jgi:hypothetical protein